MPIEYERIAVTFLATIIGIQKADRSRRELIDGNVVKYGHRGFLVADDETLLDLFTRFHDAPHQVTADRDGKLCLSIMSRGLADQLRRGWSKAEIEEHAVRDYSRRLSDISMNDLRAFMQHILSSL